MKWFSLHIDTSPAGLEPVSAMLGDLGIDGLVIEDEGDFRRFLEQNRQYWDYVDEELDRSMAGKCRVTFYLEQNEEGLGKIAAVRIAMAELKKAHPEYAPEPFTLPGPAGEAPEGRLTLWPHIHDTDGFFIAKLRRHP